MKPLWYPKSKLFENLGPTHMNLLFYKNTTFLSWSTVSSHEYVQAWYLIESTPTIILKLFCVAPCPPERSTLPIQTKPSEVTFYMDQTRSWEHQNILYPPRNWARLINVPTLYLLPPPSQSYSPVSASEKKSLALVTTALISCHCIQSSRTRLPTSGTQMETESPLSQDASGWTPKLKITWLPFCLQEPLITTPPFQLRLLNESYPMGGPQATWGCRTNKCSPFGLICTPAGFLPDARVKGTCKPWSDYSRLGPWSPSSVVCQVPHPSLTLWITWDGLKQPLHCHVGCYSGLGSYRGLGVVYRVCSHIYLSRWIFWIDYRGWEALAILLPVLFTVLEF